jgi:hypothetical protein
VRIAVYRDGVEEYDDWYNSGDAQCSAINDMLVFSDAFGDIDGDAGDGLYEVMAGFFKDAGDLYYWKTMWVYLGVDMNELAEVRDSIEAWDDNIAAIAEILDSLQSQDDWVSALTAAEVWNYLLTAYDDSSSGMAGYLLKIQDSANWVSLDDVWRNRDTVDIDSSDIGVWLTGNLKNDFDAATDSVLAKANIIRISNSLAAADSLMAMMTDSGYVLKLAQVLQSFGWGVDSSLHLTYMQICDNADSALVLISNAGGGDALQLNALYEGNGIGINTTAGYDIDADINGTIDSVNYLKSGVSCCSGSGAKSYTIYVADSTGGDTTLLSDVMVSAYSMSGDLQAGMKTDSYGKVTYATDLDSLFLISVKFNYHTAPDTIVVTAPGYTDTTYIYHGTIPTSGSPDLCRLYGFIYDISGDPDGSANITAWLPAGVSRYDSSIISPFRVETTTDSTGYFYIDLIPNVNLIPDTSKYEITIIRTDGTILRERISVPDEESWRLTW